MGDPAKVGCWVFGGLVGGSAVTTVAGVVLIATDGYAIPGDGGGHLGGGEKFQHSKGNGMDATMFGVGMAGLTYVGWSIWNKLCSNNWPPSSPKGAPPKSRPIDAPSARRDAPLSFELNDPISLDLQCRCDGDAAHCPPPMTNGEFATFQAEQTTRHASGRFFGELGTAALVALLSGGLAAGLSGAAVPAFAP